MNDKEKAALGSIAASAGLTAAKAIVGLLTGSLAILSEAGHSLARPLGDGADLFCRAHFRQAGRRRASIRPRQGRKRHARSPKPRCCSCCRRGDLGGGAAAHRRADARRRGDRRGLRHHRRLDRGRFFSRAHAAARRQGDIERGARSRCAAFRLRHVVVGRGADRSLRRRARLFLGRCRGGDRRRGLHLHRRLAARAAHHRHADRHGAGRRERARGGDRAAGARRRQRRARARAPGRRGAVRRSRPSASAARCRSIASPPSRSG